MKAYPYLICRKGTFHFRKIVPLDLRTILGQREVIRSLATTDIKIARKAAIEMADKLDELFSKIRNGAKLLSSADLKVLSQEITKSKTEQLMIEALEDFKDRQKEAVKWYRLAAEQGNDLGQSYQAHMYDVGKGVSEDSKEAVKW